MQPSPQLSLPPLSYPQYNVAAPKVAQDVLQPVPLLPLPPLPKPAALLLPLLPAEQGRCSLSGPGCTAARPVALVTHLSPSNSPSHSFSLPLPPSLNLPPTPSPSPSPSQLPTPLISTLTHLQYKAAAPRVAQNVLQLVQGRAGTTNGIRTAVQLDGLSSQYGEQGGAISN